MKHQKMMSVILLYQLLFGRVGLNRVYNGDLALRHITKKKDWLWQQILSLQSQNASCNTQDTLKKKSFKFPYKCSVFYFYNTAALNQTRYCYCTHVSYLPH